MPQGRLQVYRFVTHQNFILHHSLGNCSAKLSLSKILPVTLTRSRFCGATFFLAQWNQDFSDIEGEGVTQWLVVGGWRIEKLGDGRVVTTGRVAAARFDEGFHRVHAPAYG